MKDEILKLLVLLNITQTVSYIGREVRLPKVIKGRQRQMKIRNVSSFGRGVQLDRRIGRHKEGKIVEEITVAFIVRNETTQWVKYGMWSTIDRTRKGIR